MTHTKGEWTCRKLTEDQSELGQALVFEISSDDAGPYWIAQVLRHPETSDNAALNKECEANARLIKAAPKMEEWIKRVVDSVTHPLSDGGIEIDDLNEARDLLSEIEGEG